MQHSQNIFYKINLYNLSLLPLYIIFIIQYADIKVIENYANYETLKLFTSDLVSLNTKVLLFLILSLIAFIGYQFFLKNNKYNREDAKKFENIESKDFDHLTFLSTYILPLITFNLNDSRGFIVLIFLLVMIGAIYIKSNLYYLNPTLLLFGYKIYKAKNSEQNVTLIATQTIYNNCIDSRYIDLGNNIYFLKDSDECR